MHIRNSNEGGDMEDENPESDNSEEDHSDDDDDDDEEDDDEDGVEMGWEMPTYDLPHGDHRHEQNLLAGP